MPSRLPHYFVSIRDKAQQALFSKASGVRAKLVNISSVLSSHSSRDVLLLTAVSSIAMFSLLFTFATRLGLLTSIVTGGVFFSPLLAGGLAAMRALVRLEQDSCIATARVATAKTLASNRTPIDKDSLRRFESTDVEAAMISARVVKRVALACKDGRYEPVASILALDIPAIRAGSHEVRKMQLFAIRLGILTTFIGLMLCLYEIVPLLETIDIDNKTRVINKIVHEMAMAFGGSVAGLAAATILQIFSGMVEHQESNFFKKVEEAILSVQTYFYNSINKEPLIRSMEALGNSIKGFNTSLDEGRIEIDRAANQVILQIRSQDDILRARQDEMIKGRDAFAELVISQKKAMTDLKDALHHAAGRIADDIRTWVDTQAHVAATKVLAAGLVEGKTALAEHANAVERSLVESNRSSLNILEQVNATLSGVERTLANLRAIIIGLAIIICILTWIVFQH